ncbi:hypothetical protein RJ641_024838 [Dillenia turbinata]|uniref:DUF7953 domain-containing protein n=1 Tax=Dillenia turbinata TaxID=194707 RepID=A0AAN8W9B4_9MAGN
MSVRYPGSVRVSPIIFLCLIFLNLFADCTLSAVVTLESIEIYKPHEWLKSTPTVYFRCKGGKYDHIARCGESTCPLHFQGRRVLAGRLMENFVIEMFPAPNRFSRQKCKRCGIYEKDTLKSDDTFDEWEFCPSDFSSYAHFKDKEFNATFLCAQCVPLESNTDQASSHDKEKGKHVVLEIVISALVSTVFIFGLIAGYKYWLKKKREQEQARFLKLFEDGDDIEDELGLGTPI